MKKRDEGELPEKLCKIWNTRVPWTALIRTLHCTVGLYIKHRKWLEKGSTTLPSGGKTCISSAVPAFLLHGCCHRRHWGKMQVTTLTVAQLFRKATEARTNLAGCGSNALEHGSNTFECVFKLLISILCAGLLPYFYVINGAPIKKWMLSKASKQKRHGKSWAVVNIHKNTDNHFFQCMDGQKKNKYNHKAFCLNSCEVKLLISLYQSWTKLSVKYAHNIR